MSTITKLNPQHRVARADRKNLARVYGRVNLELAMVLNELRLDSRRTGEAKARAYNACRKRFEREAAAEEAEVAQRKITPPSASTPVTGIASPAK